MKTNPLAAVCLFFCLGIWSAKYICIPLFFVFVSCSLFLLTALVSLKRQVLFFLSLSLAIFLAGFLHLQNAQTYPPNHISHFVSDEPQKVYVMGKVASNPEISQTFYGSQKTAFTFRIYDLKAEIAMTKEYRLLAITDSSETSSNSNKISLIGGLFLRLLILQYLRGGSPIFISITI